MTESCKDTRRCAVDEKVPWRIIPETTEVNGSIVHRDFHSANAECFVWKWSPDGRYGADMPGGRDRVKYEMNSKIAIFDLHKLSWCFYTFEGLTLEIPRLAFLYWISSKLIVFVNLEVNDKDEDTEEFRLIFNQSVMEVDHETRKLKNRVSICYSTNKKVPVTYWYHIFHDRCGQPFVDYDNYKWIVFSNAKDCLILIPFYPDQNSNIKYINFDMDEIMSRQIDIKCKIDPFSSSHFVPFVWDNTITFLNRVCFATMSMELFAESDDVQPSMAQSMAEGVYQLTFDLGRVLKCGRSQLVTEDINLFRKISTSTKNHFEQYSQCGNKVVLTSMVTQNSSHELSLNSPNWQKVKKNNELFGRTMLPGNIHYKSIDLRTGQIKTFYCLLLRTDAICPHPSGSLLMFRYKDYYSMRMCEMPNFAPLELSVKCIQTLNNCIFTDDSNDVSL